MKTNVIFRMLAVVAACFLFEASAHAGSIYTFDSLTAGSSLIGQDNWGAYQYDMTVVSDGSGGKYAQGVAGNSNQSYRINDDKWGFTAFENTDTSATLLCDVKLMGGSSYGAYLGLGHDASSNSKIDWNATADARELGPLFGVVTGNKYYLRGAGLGATFTASSARAGDDTGDWVQLKLVMDFTANSGNGSGTLYTRNLTDGESTWYTAKSDYSLELLRLRSTANGGSNGMSDMTPSQWDGLGLRFDKLGIADNLTVGAVPEPGVCMMLITGSVTLLAYAWRKRKSLP